MTQQPPPQAARQAEGAELLSLLEKAERHVLWVMKLDPVERVDYVSPAVERVWGRPPEAFHADAHLWVSSIHPDDQPLVAAAYGHWLGDPMHRRYEVEFRVVRPDSSVRWVHDSGTAVLDGAGRPVRLSGIAEDITERKATEQALRDSEALLSRLNAELEARVADRTAELQAAVRELEAFSYSVSHDLRAPLRALDGFSQALIEDHGTTLPDSGRRYLGIIRDTAQKMGRLIDDLLNFARLSRQPLKRRPVDHEKLVSHVWEGLAAQREGRAIHFCVGTLPPGDGDPALLSQVWVNLIANAVKYSRHREQAVVEVGAAEGREGRIEYFVRDNGAGFDMRYAHKLFGVFERLHRAEEFEGTGVGLAIVQRIVERHGGSVRAEAEPDRGAAFFFTLG